ncbi:MmcQ/YjbR family DNA-binding protein [Mangrovimonas sp. TPBH4]|uniref:MmcQ/YjbR family DNA-binding protein n=1 Tax=Mangrovimonas sp. TPBH4 TaxID=1645914 RepID=UPI0006B68DB8|nr:MmcQ/YjbR family DNA-binding protein [Mangrovimonas sp. TPBH4]
MDIEQLHAYCLKKHKATEDFPFDEDTLVFKVLGKMFALISLEKWEAGQKAISLKCNPEYAVELREQYDGLIVPGFHLNNKHWNTVCLNGEIPAPLVLELIDHSYDMVVKAMPKKLREQL